MTTSCILILFSVLRNTVLYCTVLYCTVLYLSQSTTDFLSYLVSTHQTSHLLGLLKEKERKMLEELLEKYALI